MKNRLVDLNNPLFEQLERLNDEDLNGAELKSEIDRSKAVTDVASRIIDNAPLSLQATKLKVEYGQRDVDLPEMLIPL
ncbi:MAG: hypothetical protein ACK5KR_09020 [Breznakia sp.]